MALSARNERAEKLVREVAAQKSGENLTQAVIQALEQRAERLRGRRTATDTLSEIIEISRHSRVLPDIVNTDRVLDILAQAQDWAPSIWPLDVSDFLVVAERRSRLT